MKQCKSPTYLLNIHHIQLHPSANAPIQILHAIRPTSNDFPQPAFGKIYNNRLTLDENVALIMRTCEYL